MNKTHQRTGDGTCEKNVICERNKNNEEKKNERERINNFRELRIILRDKIKKNTRPEKSVKAKVLKQTSSAIKIFDFF